MEKQVKGEIEGEESAGQYEERVKNWLQQNATWRYLRDAKTRGEVSVQKVELQGDYPDTRIVILVVDDSRPECVFGFRARIWEESGQAHKDWRSAEEFAWILTVHIEETVLTSGLPEQCQPEEITWAGHPGSSYFEL